MNKINESMTISIYDIIDKKVKAELDERDRRNESLRDELNRVRIENRGLKDSYIKLKESFDKTVKDKQFFGDILENVKERLDEAEDISAKLQIINFYFQVILGLKERYVIPISVIGEYETKMIYYLYYVYNENKDIVRDFLMAVMPKYERLISKGYSYVVPQRRPKWVLMDLLKEQPYYTNGGQAGWLSCCFPDNPPYSEYMKNSLILEDDVFQCLCDNLCRKQEGREFIKILEYQNLNNDQLEKLGDRVLAKADEQSKRYFFNKTHMIISIDLQKRFFEELGYSTNRYDSNYILKYKDEIIEEALSKMNEEEFVRLWNGVSNGRERLLKMYFKIKELELRK